LLWQLELRKTPIYALFGVLQLLATETHFDQLNEEKGILGRYRRELTELKEKSRPEPVKELKQFFFEYHSNRS
jgi:hypothetical protein